MSQILTASKLIEYINQKIGRPKTHQVVLHCPNCYQTTKATVKHTVPFWTYIHECTHCKYLIMESEWEEIPF